ncbi:MAG TPA: DoxX family protein [Bacteroidales bacterium]|jgi:uncharacterized membrane protein YphA (DoxX/SURF4 family)|nr:DoxX family protein [Bacteroidales bacterium]
MKVLRNFSRIIIAPVFVFSGFVKAIDPLGSAYKFSDYFEAFGLDFLMPTALVLAILLSTAELVIGLNLIMGVVMRTTSWALFIFMSFFTLLTLIIALTNPVTDCGCFGDALILTNWQTFWKNILFMIPTLFIFYGRKRFRPVASMAGEWSIVLVFIITGVSLSIYTYRNLPVFDFRPYKVATHIPTDMAIPEGAPVDEYETVLVYTKDGVEKEFAPENVPYQDTAWKWLETRNTLIKEGYEPPIHDFSITTHNGWDITDSVLSYKGYSILVVAYDLERAKGKALEKVNEIAKVLIDRGVPVYGMSATVSEKVTELDSKFSFSYKYHTTDEITLKTIIRSNPGVLVLKEGVIVDKWHYNNLPDPEYFKYGLQLVTLEHKAALLQHTTLGFYLLLLVALLAVLAIMIKVGE